MAQSPGLVHTTVPPRKGVPVRMQQPRTQQSIEEAMPNQDAAPSLQNLTISSNTELPTAPQIVAHLKMLHAFACLRISIMNQQGVFGIDDSFLHLDEAPHKKGFEEARLAIAEKRWSVYVERAVERFDAWWLGLQKQLASKEVKLDNPPVTTTERPHDLPQALGQAPITMVDLIWSRPKNDPLPARGRNFPKSLCVSELPPLDVLMVWHTYMLNPRKYLEDCLLKGMMGIWHAGIPWKAIDGAIDAESGFYDPGKTAELNFVMLSGKDWSNLDCSGDKFLRCPSCEYSLGSDSTELQVIPCTTFGASLALKAQQLRTIAANAVSIAPRIRDLIKDSWGWTDASFGLKCAQGCDVGINRDSLCAKKFIDDAMKFFTPTSSGDFLSCYADIDRYEHSPPLQGTILDNFGIPYNAVNRKSFYELPEYFPIRFVMALVSLDSQGPRYSKPSWTFTMAGIRSYMSEGLKCARQVNYASDPVRYPLRGVAPSCGVPFYRVKASERKLLRRMMSYYNDNPSRFTIDLGPAVLRQGVFVQKMQGIDWLHSPALLGTASRLIIKYARFFALIVKNTTSKGQLLTVPTLDVDLAWHTHQLSPKMYYIFSHSETKGCLIDHDDKIPETDLSEAFARTSTQYHQRYNEPYSSCTCWYCEAIAATIRTFHPQTIFQRLSQSSSSAPTSQPLSAARLPEEAESAHISAHSAVRLINASPEYRKTVFRHKQWLDKAYVRAVERARREGRRPPVRRHQIIEKDGDGKKGIDSEDKTSYHSSRGNMAAGAGLGLGLVGVAGAASIYISLDEVNGIAFADDPHREDTRSGGGGAAACLPATCGSGLAFNGGNGDGGGGVFFADASGGDAGGCGGGCGG